MSDDERQDKIDVLLAEVVAKLTSWIENFQEYKADMKLICRDRADRCGKDLEDIFQRLRTAESNIASLNSLAAALEKTIDALGKMIAAQEDRRPKWFYTAGVWAYVLISLIVLLKGIVH